MPFFPSTFSLGHKTIERRWKWFHIRVHYHNRLLNPHSTLELPAISTSVLFSKFQAPLSIQKAERKKKRKREIIFPRFGGVVEMRIKDNFSFCFAGVFSLTIIHSAFVWENKSRIGGSRRSSDRNSTEENDFLHLNGHQFYVFLSHEGLMGKKLGRKSFEEALKIEGNTKIDVSWGCLAWKQIQIEVKTEQREVLMSTNFDDDEKKSITQLCRVGFYEVWRDMGEFFDWSWRLFRWIVDVVYLELKEN